MINQRSHLQWFNIQCINSAVCQFMNYLNFKFRELKVVKVIYFTHSHIIFKTVDMSIYLFYLFHNGYSRFFQMISCGSGAGCTIVWYGLACHNTWAAIFASRVVLKVTIAALTTRLVASASCWTKVSCSFCLYKRNKFYRSRDDITNGVISNTVKFKNEKVYMYILSVLPRKIEWSRF
jgi:hypothetical protein